MSNKENIKQFWDWFTKNNAKFLFVNEVEETEREKHFDEFISHLHNYCPKLFFQMGGHPDQKEMELIITAEGISEYFPMVEELVNAAPELKDWKFIKFKQPHGSGLIAKYRGKDFDPNKTMYIGLYNEDAPNEVGIHICYSDYEDSEREIFVGGTYLMLDTLLGERSTTLDINYLDVIKTPGNITDFDFGHLCDLKEYIDRVKNNKNYCAKIF